MAEDLSESCSKLQAIVKEYSDEQLNSLKLFCSVFKLGFPNRTYRGKKGNTSMIL